MRPRLLDSPLPVVGLLALVAAALIWLLLIFAGDQGGRVALPDAAGSTVEYFSDASSRMTRTEVERLPPETWGRWSGSGYFPRSGTGARWVRVTLHNPADRPLDAVLASSYFFADRVEAWIPSTGSGQVQEGDGGTHAISGEAVAAREKAVSGRDIAFPLRVPARSALVVYLRAEDFFRAFLRLEWWPEQAKYHTAKTRGLLAEGMYLGGLFALLGYNILLWLRLRLADMGWYVLYLGMVAAFMLLVRALLPAFGWALGSPALETSLALAVAASGFFLTQFARTFLELAGRFPRCDRLARGLAVALLVLAAGALTMPWHTRSYGLPVAVLCLGVAHVTLLAVAVRVWRAGVWQAKIFVLSFACLIAGSLATALVWLGRAPEQNVAIVGLMIGSALEMQLLSLAVADRFVQAQRRLVEETEQRRMMEETYADELATEVRERTSDLQEANADKDRMLVALGHDLRGPLAALTQRAEQLRQRSGTADPGGVAALVEPWRGFAGDVAGSGRQMLLLIEDIVLWARLRTGVRPVSGVHTVTDLVGPVVKLHQPLAERRGVALSAEMPETLTVRTDLVLAQTLVRNLVGNAVKFARSRVKVTASAAAGAVRLTVRDDGPGLPLAVLTRLQGGQAEGGGGMGLLLSQEIGARLGTRIEAHLPDFGGTEVSVVLPAGRIGEESA